ncbi:hypothetical protein ACHWQZ_G009080 [Mnemiopsis leidyi]
MTYMETELLVKPLNNGVSHSSSEIVRLNVGGGIFEVYRSTLERYPDTLLGNKFLLKKYFNSEQNHYFLERHKLIFSSILYFYQSNGQFYRPSCVSTDQFNLELEFFGLTAHYQEFIASLETEPKSRKNAVHENPGTLIERLWNFFKDPKSSQPARIWAIIDVVAITVAVILFIVETMPTVKDELANPNQVVKTTFFVAETICVLFFTVELVGRLICCPDKIVFLKTLMNWIDFITIIPYFVQLSAGESTGDTNSEGGSSSPGTSNTEAIVVLRVLRVVRVLKLARHSKGIIIVTKTLTSSVNELALLLFFWFIGVIIFGSIMYYIEYSIDSDSAFRSILHSSWWAVVTMSTVGYGDMYPKSAWGKLIASVCMMFSMIIIALPVTVIVSKFTRVYAKYKDKL